MSFLTRTLPRAARTQFSYAPRAFSTSFIVRKSAVDTVKDAAKAVDRAVSDKLVGGIEVGGKLIFCLCQHPDHIVLASDIKSAGHPDIPQSNRFDFSTTVLPRTS